MIRLMKLASILVRLVLALALYGAGFAMLLRESSLESALIQLGLCTALLLCLWGMLHKAMAMERKRKIAQVLRSYDLDDDWDYDKERNASGQSGQQSEPDCSSIHKGLPLPNSPIKPSPPS